MHASANTSRTGPTPKSSNYGPILRFVSFSSRRGPLKISPKPLSVINLRHLPKPPNELTQGKNGVSRRLRECIHKDKTIKEAFDIVVDGVIGNLLVAKMELLEVVVIGVCCDKGQHLSVAFVEELARTQRIRVKGWTIEFAHRDLNFCWEGKKHRASRHPDDYEGFSD